jgi:hypothetical protein
MCAGAFEKARKLKEIRAFRRFRRNGPAPIDSFDQQRQLSRRQVKRALNDRRPNEPPFLQTLGAKTQARAVPSQNLHVAPRLLRNTNAAPNTGRRAASARHPRLARRSPAACPRACKSDRPSRPVRLEHQATPSANRTRRSASASSASSDTLAPFGKLISIAPRPAPRRV